MRNFFSLQHFRKPPTRFESREAVVERLVSEGVSADIVAKVEAGQR